LSGPVVLVPAAAEQPLARLERADARGHAPPRLVHRVRSPEVDVLERGAERLDVHVRVGEPGNDGAAGEIDPFGGAPEKGLHLRVVADRNDAAVADGDGGGPWVRGVERDDDSPREDEVRRLLGGSGGCGQERGEGEGGDHGFAYSIQLRPTLSPVTSGGATGSRSHAHRTRRRGGACSRPGR